MTLTQFFDYCDSRQQWRNPFGNEHIVSMNWSPFSNAAAPLSQYNSFPGYPFDNSNVWGDAHDSRGIFWENQEG